MPSFLADEDDAFSPLVPFAFAVDIAGLLDDGVAAVSGDGASSPTGIEVGGGALIEDAVHPAASKRAKPILVVDNMRRLYARQALLPAWCTVPCTTEALELDVTTQPEARARLVSSPMKRWGPSARVAEADCSMHGMSRVQPRSIVSS